MSEFVGLGGGGGRGFRATILSYSRKYKPQKENYIVFSQGGKPLFLRETGEKDISFFASPCFFFPHISLITEEEEEEEGFCILSGGERSEVG